MKMGECRLLSPFFCAFLLINFSYTINENDKDKNNESHKGKEIEDIQEEEFQN